MSACERILHYAENVPQEAPRRTGDIDGAALNSSSSSAWQAASASSESSDQPDENWPQCGGFEINNLQMRYRSETPLVLHGVDLVIPGGSRVGVVGRTGSGKSSLLLALLRLVEPSVQQPYSAPISLDGVDTLRLGLLDLRRQLGIIPQNPVLFSGTIRSNLDPFDEYTDESIQDALEACGLPGIDLDALVTEYGNNWSQGQRQLLCLGRALLRDCPVLLLDEATSSVDQETDRTVQRTLREAFAGRTVLTIAHRMNTILDSDLILVLQDGNVAEFAPPSELLEDPDSLFSAMVRGR